MASEEERTGLGSDEEDEEKKEEADEESEEVEDEGLVGWCCKRIEVVAVEEDEDGGVKVTEVADVDVWVEEVDVED